MDERLFWLWLASGLGFAAHQLPELLARCGDAAGIYEHRGALLREKLVTPAQQKALATSRPQDFADQLQLHEASGFQVLTLSSPDYPPRLAAIADPPAVLYVQGDVSLLRAPLLIGMVGTRRPSAYGVEAARFLGRQLAAAGAVLVSGLADGLDSEAHAAALAVGRPTVAVLGTAIDQTYPARNAGLRQKIAADGAVLSEYPIGTRGQGSYFVLRNRLIAGLSRGLLVTEARRRSGTMSTVRYALEEGRDVFAVPGSIFSPLSEGTNWLLQQGAAPVTGAADLLCVYGLAAPEGEKPASPAPAAAPPAGDAAKIYALLGAQPQTLEALCEASGLAPGAVMAALTELELDGYSRQLAGRQFAKNC